ncbi:hypothetical protein HK101_003419 [Irineochytrium annulatum]|nr:hypothetical protein HK101_003419 [Irineochytrium annulatum]
MLILSIIVALTTAALVFRPALKGQPDDGPNLPDADLILPRPPLSNDSSPQKIISADPKLSFRDSAGRSRLFRGLNVVYKTKPWHPTLEGFDAKTSFSAIDVDVLSDLNLNAIRLGVHWAGLEPVRGVYNQTYLDAIGTVVRSCAKKGIYVLLEFHQDVLAPQFCGHGVPEWFVDPTWMPAWLRFPFPLKLRPYADVNGRGVPHWKECAKLPWYLGYATPAVADAFGRFYSNHDGLLDAFLGYFTQVVKSFRNETNILGYEVQELTGSMKSKTLQIINEPWDKVAHTIRSLDPTALVFFTGSTWDDSTAAPRIPGGGADYANRTISSYHYYSPPMRIEPGDAMSRRSRADARSLGLLTALTEFEMWDDAQGAGGLDGSIARRLATLRAADRWLQSWLGWSYKGFAQASGAADGSIFDMDGRRRPHVERLVGRTFAPAVAGRIRSMEFDEEPSALFRLNYTINTAIGAAWPTEVAIQRKLFYPYGVKVEVYPQGWLWWVEEGEGATISFYRTAIAVDGEDVVVTVQR